MIRLPWIGYPQGMLEGRSKEKSVREPCDSADLRQFRWTDLVAKLAATRDLREELERVEAGFNAFGEVRREGNGESKPTVNQADLSHGKAGPLDLGSTANDADQGDRE